MAARRSALADVPNAVNSPLRNAAAVSGKRTRAQAGDGREAVYGQPPTKKQIIEAREQDEENIDPRKRNGVPVTAHNKLDEPFSKRSNHPPTAFEKRLASVREKKTTPHGRAEKSQKHTGDNLESVRQWQKHYRRQFPQFVFYFDNLSDDTRAKAMRQIQSLGAREEKFFSKAVTHVVTTRAIPSEQSSTSPDEGESKYDTSLPKTVQLSAATQDQRKGATLLDAQIQRRNQHAASQLQQNLDQRKPQTQSADILSRARALGIKIWALEKLHRVLGTILDADTGDHVHESRGHAAQRVSTRQAQDADLEQLLRHEKVNGPADRDMTVATQDMVTLRGCYIYVHDMDERTKPTLVRDYSKPDSKQQGRWPQFRLTSSGRCPFIEDPVYAKKIQQQERDAENQLKAQQELAQRKTRGGLQPTPAQALVEREANLRRSPRKLAQAKQDPSKPLNAPMPAHLRRQSSLDLAAPFFGSAQASLRGLPRMVGGEPVASGMQPSNVTSAIRSQAVSSAAISSTAPGLSRRMGDTKEVSLLKRKVLASNNSIPSSHVNDIRAAINENQDPPPRAAKRKAQETLGVVHEDDEDTQRQKARLSAPKKKKVEKDPKPGYCENCRDKYEDFDEHIASRKHRKFATTQENWKELDELLLELKRPHKPDPER
ncbi:hypothetical protein PRZ48_000640 [Zasmidium cellare]|uniref:DBF4-type domain-containing protein n=1 Tax=Zasmidium cellare TaxID=395010 RepID=A0ABR0EZ17_ZASCE|nr:hypothetical protein PRZ48_000640 [Zasmidium cellare]